jgi:natural product precursor
MVVKKSTATKGSKTKLGKLKLNKETVKNLTSKETKAVKGGQAVWNPNPSIKQCGTPCCHAGSG